MYVGTLLNGAELSFTHAGSSRPLPPDIQDGKYAWKWDSLYEGAADLTLNLTRRCYIGAVQAKVTGASDIKLLIDGKPVRYTGELTPVALAGERVTLRIKGNIEWLTVSELDVLGCCDDGAPFLFPTPASLKMGRGRVRISLDFNESENTDEAFAREFLRESLAERFGHITDCAGAPVFFKLSDACEYEGERYTVSVSERGITVTAGERLTMLMACCRLCDLVRDGSVPVCEIDDKPDRPMRGFHMGLPRRDRIDFVKRLCRYVLLPLGYNHIIIEFNGAMRFDSHPEIAEGWARANERAKAGLQPPIAHGEMGADGTVLEKFEVRGIIDYMIDLGFEIIPEIQCLGHVQYITNVHPDIAEIPPRDHELENRPGEDKQRNEFYPHTYCPSNPKSLQIIYDITDEIIEVARPRRYMHIGHDEIYDLSICPVCRKKSRKEIYLGHILAMRNKAKSYGLNIMIWSDMLHNNMEYSTETHTARFDLPRDVILLDFTWYFHLNDDLEDNLLPLGFGVMIGNLYSSHFPRYKKRMSKEGMLGGEVSTWIAVSEDEFADCGKLFDLPYTAQMLWRLNEYDERNRRTYTKLIAEHVQPFMRDALRGKLGHSLKEITQIPLPRGGTAGIPEYLKAIAPEVILADGISVELSGKCDRLLIEGATLYSAPRVVWNPLTVIGEYTVEYTDGTEEKIPMKYAGNIVRYNTLYADPMPQSYYRHQGYIGTWYSDPTLESRTAEGEPVTFTALSWYNPHPEKELRRLTYKRGEADTACVMIKSLKLAKE